MLIFQKKFWYMADTKMARDKYFGIDRKTTQTRAHEAGLNRNIL